MAEPFEYAIRKDVRNNPIVREVDEARQRELWKTIAPADRSGLLTIDNIVMTPDARSYAYSYSRILTSLEMVEGLR